MPRNTIRNLGSVDQPGFSGRSPSPSPPSSQLPSSARLPSSPGPSSSPSPELPPELERLLAERQVLEERMGQLVGGPASAESAENSGAGPRFPVTPLSLRRLEDAAWADQRDRLDRSLDDDGLGQVRSRTPDRLVDTLSDLVPRTGQRSLQPTGRELVDRWRPDPGDRGEARSRGLSLGDLPNDPQFRDFEPPLRQLPSAELRSLDDTLSEARRRLDILRGGSGDLDQLRRRATERLRARRQEDRRDARRARHRDSRRDAERDQARLDRRMRGG